MIYVNNKHSAVTNYSKAAESKAKTENEKVDDKAAEASTSSTETAKVAQKTETYKPDMDKINSMKADLNNNVLAFKKMILGMVNKQGGYATDAMKSLLEIDKDTQAAAQQAISEDGEWGVDQTAARILDFAKALSGGDPSKIATLKDAVQKGFKAAEKVWGGKLPDISYQTLDKIMQGFDEWEKEGK